MKTASAGTDNIVTVICARYNHSCIFFTIRAFFCSEERNVVSSKSQKGTGSRGDRAIFDSLLPFRGQKLFLIDNSVLGLYVREVLGNAIFPGTSLLVVKVHNC